VVRLALPRLIHAGTCERYPPPCAAVSTEADVAAVVSTLTEHPSLQQVLLPSLDGHRRWVDGCRKLVRGWRLLECVRSAF
jgi:hypothetical protein